MRKIQIESEQLGGHKKKDGANIAALRAKTVTTERKSKGQYTSLLYG